MSRLATCVLPFRAAATSSPERAREAPPRAADGFDRARVRRWLQPAVIALGVLVYVSVLAAIVAPASWWP